MYITFLQVPSGTDSLLYDKLLSASLTLKPNFGGKIISRGAIPAVGLSLICSKFYLLFLPELPKFLTHYSYFIPTSSPIIHFIVYVGDNNVHNTHSGYYTGEQDIASADFSSEFT